MSALSLATSFHFRKPYPRAHSPRYSMICATSGGRSVSMNSQWQGALTEAACTADKGRHRDTLRLHVPLDRGSTAVRSASGAHRLRHNGAVGSWQGSEP